MGTLSELGLMKQPDSNEEIPKIAPLWRSRLEEPWNSSRAPKEVCTGVNIISVEQEIDSRRV